MPDLLETAVAAGTVPGAAALLAGRDGIRQESYAGVEPDTIYRIASMTKLVTTVAALQLVEDGRLELDQPVAEAIPAFGELPVLEGFDGNEPRLRPPATPATIRQLMTHTSGLGYTFLNPDLARYGEIAGLPDLFSGKRGVLDMPLASDPGTRWEYGASTDWLGQVVEAVTGDTLDVVFAERIFEPLRMTETTFAPTPEQRARMIPVHARTRTAAWSRSPSSCPSIPSSGPAAPACTRRRATTCGCYGRCCATASSTARGSSPRRPSR
jgi:methyl acetate hydrolase